MRLIKKAKFDINDFLNQGCAVEKGITEKDVDPKELKIGIEVELEHVNDRSIAKKIALDHLAEFSNYYTALKAMEKSLENGLDPIHNALLKFIEETDDTWNYITPEELEKKDLKKFYLLDIRESDAFKSGHIKGSRNIFWMDLLKEENLKKLPKDKKIILICYVGHTASQMLVALRLLGYDVSALKFGMGISPMKGVPVAGWLNFGFATVSQ